MNKKTTLSLPSPIGYNKHNNDLALQLPTYADYAVIKQFTSAQFKCCIIEFKYMLKYLARLFHKNACLYQNPHKGRRNT